VIPVRGPLVCDDADVVRRWAVAGEGITYKSWLDLREDVLAGRLQLLLDGVGSTFRCSWCPHRKQFSPAVRQLHAQLRQHLQPLLSGMPVAPSPCRQSAALADNGGPRNKRTPPCRGWASRTCGRFWSPCWCFSPCPAPVPSPC
jgi:hypothetical protein